ncbi:MAG: hypothetical protein ABIO49_08160 [Dokdonella sp.]
MHHALRCLPLGLALVSGFALADGSGTLYNEGKAITLKSAYAYRMPDPFEKSKQITRVVFADKVIDADALKDASDRDDAIDAQLRGATRVDLNLDADGSVQNVNIRTDGSSGSQSGSGWYTLTLKHNDEKRIEGSFHTNDEADKKSGHYYDLTFALDLPAAPTPGAALPANGGDAGKAYIAYLAALKKGDIDLLAKSMSRTRSAELLVHRSEPNFKMMFGFIQSQALRGPKYVKGESKGDSATLEYDGKDGEGNEVSSIVSMLREGGAWKVEKEASTTHTH